METLKATSKQGSSLLSRYNESTRYSLLDCVNKPSPLKAIAEKECRETMKGEGGDGFRIIYYTGYNFACGWETPAGLRVEMPHRSILVVS